MRYKRRALVGSAGIAATVLLHTLLVAVAVWGGGDYSPRPKLPDAVGAGANSGRPEDEIGERQILVMLTPNFQDEPSQPQPEALLLEPALPSMLQITGMDALPLPVVEIPGEGEATVEADLMANAHYAGLYESQVRARIERAWELAAASLKQLDFSCLVEISQQRDGRVREVVLAKCDESLEWQLSLVAAIQAASPLPAPPNPSAFVDRFSLAFESNALRSTHTARR